MADGSAALAAHIARIRELALLPEHVAPQIAVAVERETVAQISRGEGPDGTPWPRTKDGRQALVGAARALSVRAIGSVVLMTLVGPEAKHHLGRVKGGVRRQILPSAKLPAPMVRAIRTVCVEGFRQTMGKR